MAEIKKEGVAIARSGQRHHWIDDTPVEVLDELYCVARLGANGMVIPGSRISGDFRSPSAVCAACDGLRKQYPDADVFGSLIVDRLAGLS